MATASPGHDLAELERAITDEVDQLIGNGPSADDLERSLAQVEAHFVYRLGTVGGFGGKSDQLNAYNVFLEDPGYFERDLARYHGASATSIQAASSTYLSRERRVTLSVVPQGCPQVAPRRFKAGERVVMAVDRSQLPRVGSDPSFRFPEVCKSSLANGLRVWTVEHRTVPVVAFLLLTPVGSAADPADRPGLAALTGDLLDEGSGDRSGAEVYNALARIGARFETEVSADASILTLVTLARFADRALSLLADMATRPRFETTEFARVRDLRLTRLVQLRDLPPAVADRVFTEALFRGHPYGHTAIGTDGALRAMSVEQVVAFHRRAYVAPHMTLIAVGDASHEQLVQAVTARFCAGQAAPSGPPQAPRDFSFDAARAPAPAPPTEAGAARAPPPCRAV